MRTQQKRLNSYEIQRLIDEAPEKETINLKKFLKEEGYDAPTFFNNFSVDSSGVVEVETGRPIYLASLILNEYGDMEFWTVVNKDVKNQFSLFKIAKRQLKEWVKEYGKICAEMENIPENQPNIKWTLRLGFNEINKEAGNISFAIGG